MRFFSQQLMANHSFNHENANWLTDYLWFFVKLLLRENQSANNVFFSFCSFFHSFFYSLWLCVFVSVSVFVPVFVFEICMSSNCMWKADQPNHKLQLNVFAQLLYWMAVEYVLLLFMCFFFLCSSFLAFKVYANKLMRNNRFQMREKLHEDEKMGWKNKTTTNKLNNKRRQQRRKKKHTRNVFWTEGNLPILQFLATADQSMLMWHAGRRIQIKIDNKNVSFYNSYDLFFFSFVICVRVRWTCCNQNWTINLRIILVHHR